MAAFPVSYADGSGSAGGGGGGGGGSSLLLHAASPRASTAAAASLVKLLYLDIVLGFSLLSNRETAVGREICAGTR